MRLIDIYSTPDATDTLYSLLAESPPEANISHKAMPTMAEHQAFVAGQPYASWYLIDVGQEDFAGAVYLTRDREVGVRIFKRFRGFGYGKMATTMLMDKHGPGRYLANIAPKNFVSQAMFQDIGFKLAQYTYELQRGST